MLFSGLRKTRTKIGILNNSEILNEVLVENTNYKICTAVVNKKETMYRFNCKVLTISAGDYVTANNNLSYWWLLLLITVPLAVYVAIRYVIIIYRNRLYLLRYYISEN